MDRSDIEKVKRVVSDKSCKSNFVKLASATSTKHLADVNHVLWAACILPAAMHYRTVLAVGDFRWQAVYTCPSPESKKLKFNFSEDCPSTFLKVMSASCTDFLTERKTSSSQGLYRLEYCPSLSFQVYRFCFPPVLVVTTSLPLPSLFYLVSKRCSFPELSQFKSFPVTDV